LKIKKYFIRTVLNSRWH